MYTGEKNITYKDGQYILRIRRHKIKYTSMFNTLEEAVHTRDSLPTGLWVKASKELEVLCRAI